MTHITIKIESFGAIERLLPENLSLTCFAQQSIAEVLQQVTDQFPESFSMLERCACAMGEDIVPRQTALMQDSTVVLLSPVAGG
ncbi:MoaD/ThiS family protein [Acinetobacter sp. ANC 5579]|uniref:MoaD/ThiS family protein n=1 Tax=Acinetobacter TaxID=469 RepID=UPI0015D333C3|nr:MULTISPECIES: MoaD/ThiS family protein [Acinetobacter]MCL6236166.1 MoaD/ThiS family protein [Acinetobacter amyesii]MCL6237672.1 MoaD/ThiS family protein [Acinetobacter amyesii]UUS59067.1 MoaD/ThiS family protein [Acinetobacter sp. YH16040_T]